jgi:hypothetical protein
MIHGNSNRDLITIRNTSTQSIDSGESFHSCNEYHFSFDDYCRIAPFAKVREVKVMIFLSRLLPNSTRYCSKALVKEIGSVRNAGAKNAVEEPLPALGG